ncbi:MAG: cation diffusion facilitator family transporter [Phycisphaerae bacterium]|jgi:divalent metal cation (Fe/Co/Zn/Cd) transporter
MSKEQKNNEAFDQIIKVTWLGIFINLSLVIAKIITGLIVSSMAMVADGFHSLSDLMTDFAIILGVKISKKEPDKDHPYGHGWAENFITVFTGIPLGIAGGYMVIKAVHSIADHKISQIGMPVLTVAVIAIILKEYSFVVTKRVAVRLSSSMLYANAWDHRSDALSSLAVAIGAISSMLGLAYADQMAAIFVGLMIVFVAIKILKDSIGQFTARAVDEKTNQQIKQIISSQPQIRNWHKLRTRTVGRELFMDLHILVDPTLSITAAHDIAEALENEMHRQISQPVNIVIHIEPNE